MIWRRQRFAVPQFASIRQAVLYGRHVVIGRLCWASYNDSDFIVAGRVLGESALGEYTLGWTLAQSPLEKLTTLVSRVTPSVFAAIQDDPEALRRYLRNITGCMALIIFPVTIGMALVAPEFVPLVLGLKWSGAVIPLELLALHALIRSNVILLPPLLNVIGEERLVMWNSVVALLVLPTSFYLCSSWGTVGIAAVWVVIYPVIEIPLFRRTFHRIGLHASEYFRALWPALSGCVVMAFSIGVWKTALTGPWPLPARLASEIFVGIVAYGVVLALFHRSYLEGILLFVKASRMSPADTSLTPTKSDSAS